MTLISSDIGRSADDSIPSRLSVSRRSSAKSAPAGASSVVACRLTLMERLALLVGVSEIPFQIDKYFMWHEADAAMGAVAGFNLSMTTMALIVLYAIWFFDSSLKRPRLLIKPLFGIPMLFYLSTVLLSYLSASVPMLTLFDFWNVLQAYLLFFYVANRVQTHEDVLFLLVAFGTILVMQAGVIFVASALGMDSEERSFGPLLVTVHEGQRHGGTMHSPVLAGSTLALVWLPVATSLMVVRRKRIWMFLAMATTVGMLAILLTQTRGALLTSAIGGGIISIGMLSRGWLPRWTLPMAVLMGVMSIYPLFLLYKKRIENGDGESAIARKHLSLIAVEVISQSPLLGHGSGNCHLAAQEVANQGEYRAEWYFTIHSKYLLVWIETGLVGLFAFLAVIGTGYRYGIATWRSRDPALAAIGLSLFAALAGHSVHMAVDVFNSRTQVQMLWCVLGLAAAVYKLSRPSTTQPFSRSATVL